ncbi:hypothetical protein [Galbibacter mesophilus]|uniref:hypothetical protein n=1 Tax=Galbibacter mesophilus TaxID=379069 RepID=UPI00191DFC58|nr:hypothetical protein [Galbibacter mesophilus]MCM5664405.1 hypothetical protein [Galbibacter mesophilus]
MKIGTDIKNWKEFLERKFSDNAIFKIEDKTYDLSNGVYTITAKGSETKINFIWPDKDWLAIEDIQFYNSKVNSWSGELLGGNNPKLGKFNKENVDFVSQILEIPLKKGWTSTDYYLFGKNFKSISREGMKPNHGKRIWIDYNFGCIGTILFPFTIIIDFVIDKGVMGDKKITVVKPMTE